VSPQDDRCGGLFASSPPVVVAAQGRTGALRAGREDTLSCGTASTGDMVLPAEQKRLSFVSIACLGRLQYLRLPVDAVSAASANRPRCSFWRTRPFSKE